tara:strand:+ start:76751 stop:77893 length:1143 start_codon:yes stop_codon:yes gene_type:complete
MADCGTNRFFGPVQTHIKTYQGSFVAVEGANMTHKMNTLPSLQFPFQQVLSARITLRAGQTNYLLNHLGLGDNATFLAITALYDDKSKFEADNYVQYSHFSNKNKLFTFAQLLVLTGNSECRIEQLYLHNPNQNSAVIIEVMVAVIDEYYDFFTQNEDSNTDGPISFTNLKHTDVALWDSDDSVLVVTNQFNQPILYLNLGDINSVVQDGKILTVDETSVGSILLIFQTEYDATQGRVKITQWIDDYNNGNVTAPVDDFEPIIYFTSSVTDDDTVVPYGESLTSVDGNRAYVGGSVLSLTDYSGTITKTILSSFIIATILDFENTVITAVPATDLIIKTSVGVVLTDIQAAGVYFVYFDISDIIGNKVSSLVNVKINVEA